MKNNLLIFLIVFKVFVFFGQEVEDSLFQTEEFLPKDCPEQDSHILGAVTLNFERHSFNNQHQSVYDGITQRDALSLSLSGELGVGSKAMCGSSINFYSTNTISYIFSKTIEIPSVGAVAVSGKTVSISAGKDIFFARKNIDVAVSGGILFGNIVGKAIDVEKAHMKNNMVCPTFTISPKVCLKRLTLMMKFECWNDLSKTKFKSTMLSQLQKREGFELPNLNQSGYQFSIGFGYCLSNN